MAVAEMDDRLQPRLHDGYSVEGIEPGILCASKPLAYVQCENPEPGYAGGVFCAVPR